MQKGNLHTVLDKLERLQVDDEGRGLVFAYNEANREVSVVDRQLLLYRKHSTVTWPWQEADRAARRGHRFSGRPRVGRSRAHVRLGSLLRPAPRLVEDRWVLPPTPARRLAPSGR